MDRRKRVWRQIQGIEHSARLTHKPEGEGEDWPMKLAGEVGTLRWKQALCLFA